LPARAALAKPGPIAAAISPTLIGPSKTRWLPSGSVMIGIAAILLIR